MTIQLFPPLGLLAALAGAGTAAFWLMQSDPLPGPGGSAGVDPGVHIADGSDFYQLPEPFDAEEAILQFATRPLLAEGRKPFVPALAEQPAEVEPTPAPAAPAIVETLQPPQIRLLGIMEREAVRRALVAEDGTGEQHWLAEGEVVQGWTLTAVDDDQIRLQVGDVEITFNLFE